VSSEFFAFISTIAKIERGPSYIDVATDRIFITNTPRNQRINTMTLEQDPLWDLSALYDSQHSPEIRQEFSEALKLATAFHAKYHQTFKYLSTEELAIALKNYGLILNKTAKAVAYTYMLVAADNSSLANKKNFQYAKEVESAITQQLLFFKLEAMDLSDESYSNHAQNTLLIEYQHYLQRLKSYAYHKLPEQDERLILQKNLSGVDAFCRLFDELCTSFRYTMSIAGCECEMTGDDLLGLQHHEDAIVRERALTLFLSHYKDHGIVFTAIFNALILDHASETALRNFNDPMAPTHLANELAPADVQQLMGITESNYHLAEEYYRIKAKILHLERLKNTDIYAPVDFARKAFSFGEAKDLILSSFAMFHPAFKEIALSFFNDRRIDAFPRPGKRPGAFCIGISPETQPYILLNFTGTPRDVATLAHELGHGIHYVLAQKQNILNYNPSIPIAETASVFCEQLVTQALLIQETSTRTKVSLLCRTIEDIISTSFRQNVLTRFEERIHQERKLGLLDHNEISDIWWQENAKLYGKSVEMIESYRWGWSYIPHFVHSRFYCYAYTFAQLLALSLFRQYQDTGSAFTDEFISLLESGGSRSPLATINLIGLDYNADNFWQNGYDVLRDRIDELKTYT
jgi:oligoendopeptidase F